MRRYTCRRKLRPSIAVLITSVSTARTVPRPPVPPPAGARQPAEAAVPPGQGVVPSPPPELALGLRPPWARHLDGLCVRGPGLGTAPGWLDSRHAARHHRGMEPREDEVAHPEALDAWRDLAGTPAPEGLAWAFRVLGIEAGTQQRAS